MTKVLIFVDSFLTKKKTQNMQFIVTKNKKKDALKANC